MGREGMSPLDLLMGGPSVLMTGVEDADDGSLRVYVDARWKGLYVIVTDEDAKAEVRRAWGCTGQHVLMPRPDPDQVFCDKPVAKEASPD